MSSNCESGSSAAAESEGKLQLGKILVSWQRLGANGSNGGAHSRVADGKEAKQSCQSSNSQTHADSQAKKRLICFKNVPISD
jgi:hypothetical protein